MADRHARPEAERSGAAGLPLTVTEGRAWAELRPLARGGAELEMRDELNHWVRAVNDAFAVAPGSAWWFFGGILPEGASSVEVVSRGDRHRARSAAGLWLAAVPRDAVRAPLELVALRADGHRLSSVELPPAELPPPASVPRADLAPENAPLTLRPSRTWRQLRWPPVVLAFVVLGAFQIGPGSPLAWAVLAFFGPLLVWWMTWLLSGLGNLHLDRDGLTWRMLRTHRHRWREVAAFRPNRDGPDADVGFDFCGPHARSPRAKRLRYRITSADGELPGAYASLTPEQLAGLLNAWRDHYYARS